MAKKILAFMWLCIFLASCGGGSGSSVSTGTGPGGPGDTNPGGILGSGQGMLRVSLTDAASQEFKEINVTISGVRVHMSSDADTGSAGWHDLNLSAPLRINLLSLQNGVLHELGLLPLEAGHYQQIRLMVVPNSGSGAPFNNSVVFVSGGADVEMPLEIPTENTTGIKLVQQFTVVAGKTVDLILDFDGKNSVIAQGNGIYKLKPVIKTTVIKPAA